MVFRTGNAIFLLLVLLAALVAAPGASAWAWPVDGPVLRPFVAVGDPYAGGQHRGMDIGAPTGSDVRSVTAGVVSFVGQLPRHGLCLTIRTEDGWSATLVHLGSIGVTVGTQVGEGDVVGAIGPSGEPEGAEPYVHLGIRLTADANGYVDPLTLLPQQRAPEQPPPQQAQAQVPAPTAPMSVAAPPRSVARAGGHPPPAPGRAPHSPAAVVAARHVPARALARTTSAPRSGGLRARRAGPARPAEKGVRVRRSPAYSTVAQRPRTSEPRHLPASVPNAPRSRVAVTRVTRVVRDRSDRPRRALLFPLGALGLALVACGFLGLRRRQRSVPARPFAESPLRKMSTTEPAPEERLPEPSTTAHSRRRRLALREWPAASGACRRLRCPVGHHRPVSPAAGRRRPDGQRHRRARNAGHGRGRSRGAVAA